MVAFTHQLQFSPNFSTLSVLHQSKRPNQDFHFYTSFARNALVLLFEYTGCRAGRLSVAMVTATSGFWASPSFLYPPAFIRSPLLSCESNLISLGSKVATLRSGHLTRVQTAATSRAKTKNRPNKVTLASFPYRLFFSGKEKPGKSGKGKLNCNRNDVYS